MLSKFPLFRPPSSGGSSSSSSNPRQDSASPADQPPAPITGKPGRQRKGSLRKVALLGRGAQRERRGESRPATLAIDTSHGEDGARPGSSTTACASRDEESSPLAAAAAAPRAASAADPAGRPFPAAPRGATSPFVQSELRYVSTTNEEDLPRVPKNAPSPPLPPLPPAPLPATAKSAETGPYLLHRGPSVVQHRRSVPRAKSPLSYCGISSDAMPPDEPDWDYSDTEWWGWIVLVVTWFVFVIGMGSCLGAWSWAWDVGTTPYAPPELEDDATLPIVGYYPALLILSCIMAWVWVVVAWVGMKYFRHAKISGD